MDQKTLDKVNAQVARKIPDVTGVKPTIKKQKKPTSKGNKNAGDVNFLLTYKYTASGPGGRKIPQWVRVVATFRGKIIKISTSK